MSKTSFPSGRPHTAAAPRARGCRRSAARTSHSTEPCSPAHGRRVHQRGRAAARCGCGQHERRTDRTTGGGCEQLVPDDVVIRAVTDLLQQTDAAAWVCAAGVPAHTAAGTLRFCLSFVLVLELV